MKKLCTNGISDSSQRARVATCHDSLRRLVQDDAAVGHHEDARGSWVTMTMVMPRSRLSVTMSSSSSTAEIGSSPADGSSKNSRSARASWPAQCRRASSCPRDLAWEMLGERPEPDEVELRLNEIRAVAPRIGVHLVSRGARGCQPVSWS